MARRRRRDGQDEPLPPEDGWVQWGVEAIWAVGETAAGAPYGPTEVELREAAERENPRAGWARAKAILLSAANKSNGNLR